MFFPKFSRHRKDFAVFCRQRTDRLLKILLRVRAFCGTIIKNDLPVFRLYRQGQALLFTPDTAKEAFLTEEKRFNKKIFSMLIERACGDRSIHRFAKDADISYVQLRKLHACRQENPPGRKLMKKLAENSLNGVEYEDYAFAAGLTEHKNDSEPLRPRDRRLLETIQGLSAGQKKTAEEFIRFLAARK